MKNDTLSIRKQIKMTVEFFAEAMKARNVAQCFSNPERKGPAYQNSMVLKISFRNEGKIKAF